MLAAPNRAEALSKVRLPTLIMHGTLDPLIRPAGGQGTHKAIPGATLVMLHGVGHGAIPRQVWPTMLDNISAIAG